MGPGAEQDNGGVNFDSLQQVEAIQIVETTAKMTQTDQIQKQNKKNNRYSCQF